jgi:hypothetical protein
MFPYDHRTSFLLFLDGGTTEIARDAVRLDANVRFTRRACNRSSTGRTAAAAAAAAAAAVAAQ